LIDIFKDAGKVHQEKFIVPIVVVLPLLFLLDETIILFY